MERKGEEGRGRERKGEEGRGRGGRGRKRGCLEFVDLS
jgi:hypothetical protein